MLNSTGRGTSPRYYESSYKQNEASYLMNSNGDVNAQTIQSRDYDERARRSHQFQARRLK